MRVGPIGPLPSMLRERALSPAAVTLRSKPAQNVPCAPWKTAILLSSSASKVANASASSPAIAGVTALRASRRSRMIVVIEPSFSTRIDIRVLPRRAWTAADLRHRHHPAVAILDPAVLDTLDLVIETLERRARLVFGAEAQGRGAARDGADRRYHRGGSAGADLDKIFEFRPADRPMLDA